MTSMLALVGLLLLSMSCSFSLFGNDEPSVFLFATGTKLKRMTARTTSKMLYEARGDVGL